MRPEVPPDSSAQPPRGVVLACVPDPGDHASGHERTTLRRFASQLAALKGYEDGGFHAPGRHQGVARYFVPSSTLTCAQAAAIGIRGPDDLFGGVVPHAFVGTKAISHPLVAPDAAAPAGWQPRFAAEAGDAVLAGYTAFSAQDASRAGLRLLQDGPLRLKPAHATGGQGQEVVRDAAQLQRLLQALAPAEFAHGVVLEQDLADVQTCSVGQVCVGPLLASYFGWQRLTRDNAGHEVYGGSDLTVVRGGFDALLESGLQPQVRHAVERARWYDAAVRACFEGFFASRSNYDIVFGTDAAGRACCGVLEQSWRVGGATGPELVALQALGREPARTRVRTRGLELFGPSPEPPPGATVYFRGEDPQVGLLTKYTVIADE